MAEATGLRNNALPYPIYGAPFGVVYPMLDADGDLVTGATTPDAEVSKNGDTFADCTNESTEIATTSGIYYLLLTATEMTADVVAVIAKSATAGMKTTPFVLYPRKLVTLRAGTAAGGATGNIVLDSGASDQDDFYNGMICIATIDSNVEARVISDYTGSSKTASVVPDWNVAPDSDDTFVVKIPPGGQQIYQSNVTQFGGAAITSASGIPEVKLANGVTHGGSTAKLQLGSSSSTPAMLVESSGGDAMRATSSGGNGHGFSVNGNGSGQGLSAFGGATGAGAEFRGGATSGSGLVLLAATNGPGLSVTAAGNNNGISAFGSGTGEAVKLLAGATGNGLEISGGATSGDAILLSVTSGVKLSSADFTGAVATDGSNSATSFKTTLTQTATDHWKASFLKITSGALLGQVRKVTAYDGSTKFITVDAFSATPADAVTFDLINE